MQKHAHFSEALGRTTMIRQAVELDSRSIDSFDSFSCDRNEDINRKHK